MKQVLLMISLGFLAALSACGPRVQDLTVQEEITDRSKLRETYEKISGVYRGLLSDRPDGSDSVLVELSIYTTEEQNGLNENGEVRLRPALRARYRRLDLSADGIAERTLVLRYYRETRELGGVTTTAQGVPGSVPDGGYLSISGSLTGELLVGEVSDHRGRQGRMSLERIR